MHGGKLHDGKLHGGKYGADAEGHWRQLNYHGSNARRSRA
jgi:hypothetical protein